MKRKEYSAGTPNLAGSCSRMSVALNKPALSSAVVLGDLSIGGTIIKVEELANNLAGLLGQRRQESTDPDYICGGFGNRSFGIDWLL